MRRQTITCHACGTEWQRPTGLGRPPLRCGACRRSARPPSVTVRVVLGPCPCLDCRAPLTWNGWGWDDATGNRHVCARAVAA